MTRPPADPAPSPAPGPAGVPAPSVWNIANGFTMLRLVLVPVFCWLLFIDDGHVAGSRILACAAFVVAIMTDRFDGELARKHNLVTDFGKVADPIADKALTGAAFIGLSLLGDLPWWVTVVVLVREWGVTALRFWVIRIGVIPATRGGKLKTVLQAVALGLYLLPWQSGYDGVWFGVYHWVAVVFMAAAVVVTVVTGLDYVGRAVRLHAAGRSSR